MNKINLINLLPILRGTYITLDLIFLEKLLKNASHPEKPHRNVSFLHAIGSIVNAKFQFSPNVYQWLKGTRTVPFDKLVKIVELSDFSWTDIEKNLISIKAGIHKGEIYSKFPIIVGKEMGSIIGHILGDDSLDKRYSQIFFSNTNIELLQEFSDYIFILFGVKPCIWLQTSGNFKRKPQWIKRLDNLRQVKSGKSIGLFYPAIVGLLLNHTFDNFAVGKCKKITPLILHSSKEFKKALIRAFFDDECSVYPESYTMLVFQDNKSILRQMKRLLLGLGISSNKIRTYVKRNKDRGLFQYYWKR